MAENAASASLWLGGLVDGAMLRFAEELLLLLLNEDAGDLAFVPESARRHALAGAALMDLALERRIDTDANQLMVIDPSPVGDEALDPVLTRVAASREVHDAEQWVRRIAEDADRIQAVSLRRLVAVGVLRSAESGDMAASPTVSRAHRYPSANGEVEQEVRSRIMGVLFGDDIPAPRDIVIICLANACGMFERLLGKAELEEVRERLDLVGRLDLIGQAVTRAVRTASVDPPERAPTKEIPKVKGGLLLGSARAAGRDVRALFTEQYLKLGPVFEVRLLHRRQVVLAGPEANEFLNRKGRFHLSTYGPWRGLADGFQATRVVLNMEGRDTLPCVRRSPRPTRVPGSTAA